MTAPLRAFLVALGLLALMTLATSDLDPLFETWGM